MSDRWAALKRRLEHMGDPFDPAGTMDKRKVWLADIVEDIEKRYPEQSYIPTKRGRFCNQADAMGNGCKDSWWTGGNYGGSLCRNPAHHEVPGCECLVDGACAQAMKVEGSEKYRCRRDGGEDSPQKKNDE